MLTKANKNRQVKGEGIFTFMHLKADMCTFIRLLKKWIRAGSDLMINISPVFIRGSGIGGISLF